MISFLKETLRSKKRLFLSAIAMTALLKISMLSPPLLLGRIIDHLSLVEDMELLAIAWLIAALCIAVLVQSIFHPLQTYQLVSLVQSTLAEMSSQWTEIILGKEFESFSSLRIGGLIKSVERGITAHEKLLTFFITSGIPLVVELTLIAAFFAYLGGVTIFLTLMAISIGYLLLYRSVVNWRRPYLLMVNNQEDRVSSRLFEILRAGKMIKLEQAGKLVTAPLCKSYFDYANAAIKVASTGAALGSIKILYLGLSTAGLLAWGVIDQISDSPRLSIGELVAVFSIAGMFLGNFSALAEAYRALDQFQIDKRKLQETLSLPDVLESPQALFPLRVSSLSVLVAPGIIDQPLSFLPDQSVAIIGPSGSGKTTLLETLAGVLEARRKFIVLDGNHLASCDIQRYLTRVRYCPQHPIFVEGVFAHAVLFDQILSPDLADAIDALGLRNLAATRCISEGAKNISGGEAKRLSLLRLINRPGDFNLFDEPTGALDQKTALRVWDTIFTRFDKQGLICTTHDLSVLARFDRVIVMRQGAVIADGRWAEISNDEMIADLMAHMGERANVQ